MKKIIVLFLMLFICCNSVFADKCSSSQIVAYQKEAAKIKVDYEIIENENLDDSIKINIYNLAEDLFIIKTDDILEEDEYLYYSSFNNNMYSFITYNIEDLIKYTFEIWSTDEKCDVYKVKTINFTKPKFNTISTNELCVQNPEVPVCAKYITQNISITEENLEVYINKYLNNQDNNLEEEIVNEEGNFFKNNYIYIIIGLGVISVSIVIYIIISKNREKL